MTVAEPFQPLWQAAGFKAETPIQEAVYQPLKHDENIIGLAPTGSGKTLAFGLPLLEKLVPGGGLQLLILSPSQELAIQTRDVLRPYADAVHCKLVAITGSANVKRQIDQLKTKPEVIVATAGRLLELIGSGKIKLNELDTLVVDEADELLRDPGFNQVRSIAQAAPAEVQLTFFSATTSPIYDEMPKWFGQEVRLIDVRAEDHTQGAVQHFFIQTDNAHRVVWLRRLAQMDNFQALVFFNQNATLEKVAGILRHQSVKFDVLARTDRSVNRANALARFRKGKVTLLLASDLAGRGLDIPKLPAVINYQSPKRAEAYIHRAGRTGRMGAAGMVITLGDDHDRRDLKKLVPQYDIKRGFIEDWKLTSELPSKTEEAQRIEETKERQEKKTSARTPETAEEAVPEPKTVKHAGKREPAPKPKLKHRKNRLRDRKNKGKPHNKKK